MNHPDEASVSEAVNAALVTLGYAPEDPSDAGSARVHRLVPDDDDFSPFISDGCLDSIVRGHVEPVYTANLDGVTAFVKEAAEEADFEAALDMLGFDDDDVDEYGDFAEDELWAKINVVVDENALARYATCKAPLLRAAMRWEV